MVFNSHLPTLLGHATIPLKSDVNDRELAHPGRFRLQGPPGTPGDSGLGLPAGAACQEERGARAHPRVRLTPPSGSSWGRAHPEGRAHPQVGLTPGRARGSGLGGTGGLGGAGARARAGRGLRAVHARASVWQGQQRKRVQEKEEECGLEELVPSRRPCLGTCRVSGSVLGSMRHW